MTLFLPFLAILETDTTSTVVGICGKRGDDFDAIGYGNLLRCPCRSQFRALIGTLWIAQGQSAPRIRLDVLADKHNPAVRHISTPIRLGRPRPNCLTKLSLNLDIMLHIVAGDFDNETSIGLGRFDSMEQREGGPFCDRGPPTGSPPRLRGIHTQPSNLQRGMDLRRINGDRDQFIFLHNMAFSYIDEFFVGWTRV